MGFYKQTIRDIPIGSSTVLLRVNFDVPMTGAGKIADDYRIRASLPTIRALVDDGCTVVAISHMGRPDGRDPKLSLEPAALRLAELLRQPVRFVSQTVGDKVAMAVKRAPRGSVVMLENLRFHREEEADDEAFARRLAKDSRASYFVQDGFGVVHRAHASTSAITRQLPSVAGLSVEREYTVITEAMRTPARPLVAVIGGAKVSDKIGVIKAFIGVADKIIIGGAMANTFLNYKGIAMGRSKLEANQADVLDDIYRRAIEKVGEQYVDDFLIIPTDVAVATAINPDEPRRTVDVRSIASDDIALDIGEATIERAVNVLGEAGTVIWNGTLGYAELTNFAHGSARIALELASHPKLTSVIGGGDTADFVLHWDARGGRSFTHVSTGGGASLELMAGKKLPGVESLLDARPGLRYTKNHKA